MVVYGERIDWNGKDNQKELTTEKKKKNTVEGRFSP